MNHTKTRRLVLAAMFTAITAVAAQMIIPLGFTPVPFTFAMVAIYLTGAVLDKKTAFAAQLTYIVLGAAGAPVFSGFAGGLHKITGPTGGYLVVYPLMAFIIAVLAERWGKSFWKYCVSMLLALLVCYTFGTIQLMLLMKTGLLESLGMAVIPFIPLDLVKIVLSASLAVALNRALGKSQLLISAI